MADLEIKHLRMIRMIAMTKNLTKAAEKLFISQPALSQQLINIENRIGTKLFFRNGKNMVLTKIGNRLLNSAHIILGEIEKAEREVAQEVHGEKGELKIGIRCVLCFKWIPSVVKEFQIKYPNIDIIIENSLYAEDALISKKYDLVITSTPSPLIKNKVFHVQLFENELVCVMSAGHPFCNRKHLNVEDFEGVDYIALTDTGINYFRDRGVNIRRFLTIPYPETIVDLVETGSGIALLPKWYIYPYTLTKKSVCVDSLQRN